MSQVTPSIQKLLARLGMVPQELDMLERLLKEQESDIVSLSTYMVNILEPRSKLAREQQVRVLVRDWLLAIKEDASKEVV